MATERLLAGWRQRLEQALERHLPAADSQPERLHAAMRYAVLGEGKRLRPLLAYATGSLCGAHEDALDHAAVAVELIHAYSLVHDDLPAMDDDDLRRGKPTVHRAFDEATAILVGDALQARAFEVLAQAPAEANRVVLALQILAAAAGSVGMCGGQMLDMQATGQRLDLAALADLHARKTGALIRAAVDLGAVLGGADAVTRDALAAWSTQLGLAFQIRDDILDVEASSATLGKTAGKDAAQAKATYVSLLGMQGAKTELSACAARLDDLLSTLSAAKENGQTLSDLAAFAVGRGH